MKQTIQIQLFGPNYYLKITARLENNLNSVNFGEPTEFH